MDAWDTRAGQMALDAVIELGRNSISKRDYFAAQAMTALVAKIVFNLSDSEKEQLADAAYSIADKMIERSRK